MSSVPACIQLTALEATSHNWGTIEQSVAPATRKRKESKEQL